MNMPNAAVGSTAVPTVKQEKLPEFDPDLSPSNPANVEAGQARGLTFQGGSWRDEDGCMILDQFGQPF